MTLDKSYYSSVRNPSGIDIKLIKNRIPLSTPSGESSYALFTNFTKANNLSQYGEENIVGEVIERPIGNFGLYVKTDTSNEYGKFENEPEISLHWRADEYHNKFHIFIDDSEEECGLVTMIECEFSDGFLGQTETIRATSNVIEINSPMTQTAYMSFKIKSAEANKKVKIGAILVDSEVLKVDDNDIQNVSINMSGDITGAKLTSKTIDLSLFDNEKKYNNDFNLILVSHNYKNKDGSVYNSPSNLFVIKPNEVNSEQISEIIYTKIRGIDVLNSLTAEYISSGNEEFDLDAINAVIDEAKIVYRNNISLQTDYETITLGNNYAVNSNIFRFPFSSALHALSAYGIRIPYSDKDILKFPEAREIIAKEPTAENISFKEQYQRPKPIKYPYIKMLWAKFVNTSLGEKELFADNIPQYISPTSDTKIKIPDGVYVPNNENSLVLVNGKEIGADENVGLSYFSQGGYVYIHYFTGDVGGDITVSIYGYRINSQDLSATTLFDENGEDLEIGFIAYAYPKMNSYVDALLQRIGKVYSYVDVYELSMRGRFEIELYDTVFVEVERNVFQKCVVVGHKLNFNGTHNSEIKVVAISEPLYYLYPSNTLYPNDTLLPSDSMKGAN